MNDPLARSELVITDPVQLRALAHPARQRLITELFCGEVLTATEAAKVVGLSPSATSYHLRALEKVGIVEREKRAGDGRERPWRATAETISIRPEAHRAAGSLASQTALLGWLADLDDGLARVGRAVASEEPQPGVTSRGRIWLTDEEVTELGEVLRRAVASRRGRTRADHPPGARAWDVYSLVLPVDEPEPPPREPRASDVDE
ncbi:ArsR/SmtB family transcription factor [Janibacter indicus]|uniref:ArsR/SmtB family transcription factor n=1 Tax=Janibacter indicus TaxID=857417 RepID=UPI003D9A8F20